MSLKNKGVVPLYFQVFNTISAGGYQINLVT
jgi:hypothetical protein